MAGHPKHVQAKYREDVLEEIAEEMGWEEGKHYNMNTYRILLPGMRELVKKVVVE